MRMGHCRAWAPWTASWLPLTARCKADLLDPLEAYGVQCSALTTLARHDSQSWWQTGEVVQASCAVEAAKQQQLAPVSPCFSTAAKVFK